MSSSAQAEASVPKEEKEKKGFGRVLSRVRTVLKREGSSSFSKRQSTVGTSAPATTKPSTSTAEPKTEAVKTPKTPEKRYVIIKRQVSSDLA